MKYRIFKQSDVDPGYILGEFDTRDAAKALVEMMTKNLKYENKQLVKKGRPPFETTYKIIESEVMK